MWHRTQNELAAHFEENRPRLRAVALRMLGSPAEADDAVQEAWLRLSRAGDGVDNLSAWLTTVVGRVCLDMLRQRTARREDEFPAEPPAAGDDPEQQALLADSVGLALLVVLETLTPAERLAFVLHDLFAVSFEEIAPIVGRSPDAARQLASRARRRVRATPPEQEQDAPADRQVVDAFLTASRGGELGTLLALLDPDVEMRVDQVVQNQGADAVARFFAGRARAARTALINGAIGFAVIVNGQVKVATRITVTNGRITTMDAITSPADLANLAIQPL
ncbi:RNA polymerase sigma-70 factor (ECF subfamily) [Actinoplanes tereljensis]|uniref:RNA polymerase sigma factor n=1 Tax=Paractinoplanes tereljensis TaxID=571912 RepID=A0A919NX91_9ACTN|nr:sigma-70 family RNA polymerase sigma factor [Actinoplanes tereljensis]GIF26423.1 RNA polymerase sigma factor [Actinoplanes tereljensis]